MSYWLNLNAAQLLIVTQDVELSDFLQEILSDAGYSIQKAYTLEDARFMVGYSDFDLVVIDGNTIQNNIDFFLSVLTDGLLFGELTWVAVVENEPPIFKSIKVPGKVNLLQSGYSPKSILTTIAQTLDQSTEKPATQLSDNDKSEIDPDARRLFERKLREQQALSTIARAINSTLDLNAVLTKVVDAATSITSAEEGLLLLPDTDGKTLYIRAAKGIDSKAAKEFRIKTEDTLAGQVFKTGQPLLVGDAGWQKVKTEYFVKSLLYVPLTVRDTVIGVLGISNRNNDRTFDNNDLNILLDLASHAGITIENARLYGESVTRSRELAILFTASQAVNSTLALDEVLNVITEQVVNALEIGACEIAIRDGKILKTLALCQRSQWQIKQFTKNGTNQSPTMYQAIANQQRIFLSVNHNKNTSKDIQYLEDNNATLICMFPLMSEKRPIGVFELIYVESPRTQSTGISTLHIHQQALQLMVTVDSMSITNIQSQNIAQNLLKETGADFCTLHLWDETQQLFHKRWAYGQAIWTEVHAPQTPLEKYPLLRGVLQSGEPLHLQRSGTEEAEVRDLLDKYGARTLLIMPLVITGEIAGLVFLADTLTQRGLGQRKVDMASALIVQAANALKNAWLYRDLQKSMEELRLTQGQLIQAARLSAMGELAAAVAHQINNPLTTVLGDTEMMLQDMTPNDRDYESMTAVNRAGKRAHEVVRRLLVMAHQSDDTEPPRLMDVNETIHNTLMLVSKNIEQHHVQLKAELDPNLPKAFGLSGQLEDVWMNLLFNARDAVAKSPNPTVGIRSQVNLDQKMVEVEVWDNGTGIPASKQEEIFHAFYTTKPVGEGTGLGLHICKKVVEKCNGEIGLKYTSPRGTAFIVRLPMA